MIAVEKKKKDLIDQFFYLQRSEQRPRELIELAQGHETEQWWDLDQNSGVLTPGSFFPLLFLFSPLHMTNSIRAIATNVLGISMNITGIREDLF